jgi:hypothetical protein
MNTDNTTIVHDTTTLYTIFYILLLIVEIPSITCALLILTYSLFNWHSMITKALHNHAVILLIVVSLFYSTLDLPFTIIRYYLGYDPFQSLSFCYWWYWIDYTLLATSLILTATASVQRHILIFNVHWLRIRRTRWLFHFIPLIIPTIYPAVLYSFLVTLYPCPSSNGEVDLICPGACYSDAPIPFTIDWIINYISPICIIVLANITLIIRVICSMQKVRRRQVATWKRQRKLTLQLLSFSLLYIFGWVPYTFVTMIQMFFIPNLFDDMPEIYYIYNSIYFVCPLQSFICLFALPDVLKWIKNCGRRVLWRPTVTNVVSILQTT